MKINDFFKDYISTINKGTEKQYNETIDTETQQSVYRVYHTPLSEKSFMQQDLQQIKWI